MLWLSVCMYVNYCGKDGFWEINGNLIFIFVCHSVYMFLFGCVDDVFL